MTYLQLMTAFHTLISILAMLVGIPALAGLFRNGQPRWTSRIFLVLAGVTSLTGFFFPFAGPTPGIVTAVIALVILAGVLVADYRFMLKGASRGLYAAGIVASEYLLVFVALVQGFRKIGLLHRLAPTPSDAPFVIAQLLALALFLLVGLLAVIRFRPQARLSGFERSAMFASARAGAD